MEIKTSEQIYEDTLNVNKSHFNEKWVRVDDICEFIDRNEKTGMDSDMIIHCLLLQFISRDELSKSNKR